VNILVCLVEGHMFGIHFFVEVKEKFTRDCVNITRNMLIFQGVY